MVLKDFLKKWKIANLLEKVKKGNKSSNELFKSCGFIFIMDEDEPRMHTYILPIGNIAN